MAGLNWLIARPVAHRGLHDSAAGTIENTPSAFAAAVASNYAIECDLQLSADSEAMVFHDDTLERLTQGSGRVNALPASALKRVTFRATSDHMITLGELSPSGERNDAVRDSLSCCSLSGHELILAHALPGRPHDIGHSNRAGLRAVVAALVSVS